MGGFLNLRGNYSDNTPFIKLNNVSFSYPKSKFIFKNISLEFYKNEFIAIVGPNGSGKTTLGKLMMGILVPVKGTIFIKGEDVSGLTPGNIGKKVGYLFQEPERQLFTSAVKEEISFALSFMGESEAVVEEKSRDMIELFSLQGLEDYSPYKLSRGERQRLALAAILINEPDFLVLDEPTTGLDIVRKNKLSDILKKLQNRGLGLAVISHDEEFINKNADRIIKVVGGEVIETGPQD